MRRYCENAWLIPAAAVIAAVSFIVSAQAQQKQTLYKDDAGEKRVKPGDFIRIPAKTKHWNGGDAKDGALFYEESSGKFDLIPTK